MPHELIRRLPKVELHRHLEGSLRLETLLEANQVYKLGLNAHTLEEMERLITMKGRRGSARAYLEKFTILRTVYRSPELIDRFAYEAVADAAADNVHYLELRFTPRALAQACTFTFEDVTGWVCEAVGRASVDFDIHTRLILSMNRHENLRIGERIAQVAVDNIDRGIVGLDLGGYEQEYPARPFGSIFVHAKQEGLGITVHAGEWKGAEEVHYAIENLYADRLGHGVRIVEDSNVVRLARERGIVFEVCPTSNVQSGVAPDLSHHPLRDMCSLALTTTLNTDNACVSATSVTQEMIQAVDKMHLSLRDLKHMTLNAARASFLPPADRQALVTELGAMWDQ